MSSGWFAWLDDLFAIFRYLSAALSDAMRPLTTAVEQTALDASGSKRAEIIRLAQAQVGKPYRLGAEADPADPDPPEFDCSELVEWAVRRAGLSIPDGARAQYRACSPIAPEDTVAGDLVFLADLPGGGPGDISHVGIVGPAGSIIEASKSGGGVRSDRTVRQWQSWKGYKVLAGRIPGVDA